MLTENEKKEMRQIIKQNKHEVFILSLEEMDHVITKGVKGKILKEQWKKLKDKAEFSANNFASGKDTFLLAKLMGDLGYAGSRAYIKNYGGKAHIILKGYPGLRKILTGTKYGVQNAKVVQMGLGKHGAVNAAKGGGILTIILLSAFRVIDYFMNDAATLNQLIGTLATDVVKVGIATGASIAFATGVAATGFVIAFGPLAVAILVGVGVTLLLDDLDERYQITNKVISALDEIDEKGIQGIIEEKRQAAIKKSKEITNDIADSVIDYAVKQIKETLVNSINKLLKNITVPGI